MRTAPREGVVLMLLLACGVAAPCRGEGDALPRLSAMLESAGHDSMGLSDWPELNVSHGRAFRGPAAVYVLIEDPAELSGLSLPRLANPVLKAYLLGDPSDEALTISPEPRRWHVALPVERPGGACVLVIATQGRPILWTDDLAIRQRNDRSIHLHAYQAQTSGEKIRYEPQPHKNTVGYWVNPADFMQWRLDVRTPGRYEVHILQGCGKDQGGSEVRLSIGREHLDFIVEDTGHFQNFKWRRLGTLSIPAAGQHILKVSCVRLAANAVMDVRAIRLAPID